MDTAIDAAPWLREIDVSKCVGVTAASLRCVVGAPGVGRVNVTNCTGIAIGEINELREEAREAGSSIDIVTSAAVSREGTPLAHGTIRRTG
jgi:hypothetical protein